MNFQQARRPIFEFIIELGLRLKVQSLTIGYAAIYCHKVLRQKDFPFSEICPYTLAAACMLVAGKVTNEVSTNTRDIMNVSYCILHPNEPNLEIGELSYALKESLIEMELVVMRYLQFKLNFDHPHQDLVLICAILRDWYPTEFEANPQIDKMASVFLQDLYVCPQIVTDHKCLTLAIACMSMTFSALQLRHIIDQEWVSAFSKSIDSRRIEKVKLEILTQVYELTV